MLAASDVSHTRIRRLLNPAFSDGALRDQEPIINGYISLLIRRLRAKASSDVAVDLVQYFNFTTFDILGDLCFDEPFGALEKEEYHEWMSTLFKALKYTRMFRIIRGYPMLATPVYLVMRLLPGLVKARQRHASYTTQKTDRRMEAHTDKKDFMR